MGAVSICRSCGAPARLGNGAGRVAALCAKCSTDAVPRWGAGLLVVGGLPSMLLRRLAEPSFLAHPEDRHVTSKGRAVKGQAGIRAIRSTIDRVSREQRAPARNKRLRPARRGAGRDVRGLWEHL